jgi:hypothetical protein
LSDSLRPGVKGTKGSGGPAFWATLRVTAGLFPSSTSLFNDVEDVDACHRRAPRRRSANGYARA